ncbi:ModD protein [Rubrivivax gelatinosus]|uniref:Putative pyrophosphorylase ModD n=1 Tax=Rubrivivax gelatinosus TaxID=28068 RepID=A0ABS1E0E9_RUBGE|nr:ModD protein [Rubrivivax gelatinosus]MBK1715851.1 ModD protein [Rubrivivax gelatinosus]
MNTLPDPLLLALLHDDVPCGDLTTQALGLADAAPARLEFRARQAMTVCAVEEAERLFVLAGASARRFVASGRSVAAGERLLAAQGPVPALHTAWKTAQTLVEWASGLATATAALVAAAQHDGRRVPVACTRKTVPGTKWLSAKAVRAGGATLHRLGLSETLLVFPEHRLYLREAPAATVARLHAAEPEKKLVVEVCSGDDAAVWAEAGADVLQLEKFSPEQVAACREGLAALARRPLLAVAGGVRADNAAAYAAAGADLLVSSAPYTAPPCDVRVEFHPGDSEVA